jgi:hypothetical protein
MMTTCLSGPEYSASTTRSSLAKSANAGAGEGRAERRGAEHHRVPSASRGDTAPDAIGRCRFSGCSRSRRDRRRR